MTNEDDKERIGKLEDEIRQRDRRIAELKDELAHLIQPVWNLS
jgi:hypothetical protein